ncbi:hypothetical protein [Methylobacterium sp. J-076]|uniref:hypothetical protein n=1 Tax=Methylobacterium sp. J-076 TaxID=2836655 RepID=UPI001FBBCD62|nr:hypothetical protein [Methylobacterium sp. J-076]MCJ2010942.1 hypothetical protein [Methylobacterium sp. J-076]
MGTTEILGLFAALGIVCGFYVTVVGFALTALAIVLVLAVAGAFVGGLFGGWMMVGAFVAMQVGYVACVAGSALVGHVRRLSQKDPRRAETDLHINHE